MTVDFEIEGQIFVAPNGDTIFKFNEAISFQVLCETQKGLSYAGKWAQLHYNLPSTCYLFQV
jgi:predicted 3-demethylubiquinone-9 3-methyltransferase (glyoxalase superfamily)